jgi:uncharacterized SAM-binding protein YcdF (DUF218 family)
MERADAILVLSGSSRIAERNHLAAQLFLEGRAPRIILTNDNQQMGWDTKQQRNPLSYEWARRVLESDGVPSSQIDVILPPVYGTYDELERVRSYVEQHQLRSVLVVTSAYHSRRTWWTIHQVFKDKSVDFGMTPASPTLSPWSWWLHFSGWKMVPGEYVKMVYYWLRF